MNEPCTCGPHGTCPADCDRRKPARAKAVVTEPALINPKGEIIPRSVGAPKYYALLLGEVCRPPKTIEEIMAQGYRETRVEIREIEE